MNIPWQLKSIALLLIFLVFATHRVGLSQSVSPDFEHRLSKGDPSSFETVSASRSLNELYQILTLALHHQFCGDRTNCAPGDNSDKIKALAIGAIRRIPEHAKMLGDEIDQSSVKPGEMGLRRNNFFLLSKIASPEAIAELGRFLFDDRNPEGDLPPDSGLNTVPNSLRAANAIGAALGNKPGIKNRNPGSDGPPEVLAWQTWWQSPAANEYRAAQAASVQSTPPTQPRKDAEQNASEVPSELPTATPWSVWAVMIGALLALIFLLFQKRR